MLGKSINKSWREREVEAGLSRAFFQNPVQEGKQKNDKKNSGSEKSWGGTKALGDMKKDWIGHGQK